MSSRDIGPALPPHMRRNHRSTNEDVGDNSEERSRDMEDERRRKHRDKYVDRERQRDKDRGRSRRDEYRDRDRDRSSRHLTDRERDRQRDKRGEDKKLSYRRERKDCERKERDHNSSSRRSKRSKTDRTYNTDTEESSDDGCLDPQELTKAKESGTSETDEDEKGSVVEHLDALSHISQDNDKPSLCVKNIESKDSLIGPALPPHLSSKESFPRVEPGDGGSETNALSSTSKPHSRNEASPVLPYHSESESQHMEKETDNVDPVGPALPPHLKRKVQTEEIEDSNLIDTIGPVLPPHLESKHRIDVKAESTGPLPLRDRIHDEPIEEENDVETIGPALPSHMRGKVPVEPEDGNYSADSVGPALPPHMFKKQPSQIGPSLPPHLMKETSSSMQSDDEESDIGPALPHRSKEAPVLGPSLPSDVDLEKYRSQISNESSDEEVVGPLLPNEMNRSGKNFMVQVQLERNAAAIKRKLQEKDLPDDGTPKREDWMLELPPEGTVDLGLGARTFRARGAPEKGADRSAWTDTPADKARKEEEAKRRYELGISSTDEIKKVAVSKDLSSRDKSMEAVVKKHKRSKESLLDSHQKKIEKEKKKKEKCGEKQERRPFNRDVDLKTNVFDDAQKKAIYKKAQFLDNRFSSGESKYL